MEAKSLESDQLQTYSQEEELLFANLVKVAMESRSNSVNKLTCVNCGSTSDVEKRNDTISRSTSDHDTEKYRLANEGSSKLTRDAYESEFHNLLCSSVKERILDLISDSKINKSLSEELTRAQLIEIYLRILERFEKI